MIAQRIMLGAFLREGNCSAEFNYLNSARVKIANSSGNKNRIHFFLSYKKTKETDILYFPEELK